jgi:predicted outer membrane protein
MGYFPQAAFLRRSEAEVALLRLLQLQGRAFDPAVVNVMVTAFDDTLRELKLSSRHDPLVERVAQTIIECAENGMRDAAEMRDCALKAIRNVADH